jgi:hypothetical protein
MSWTRWLLALLLLTASSGAALAQPAQPKQYRPLPYSGSLAEIYKEQMLQAKGLEGLKDLIDQINKDPDKFKKLLNNKNLKPGDAAGLDPATLQKLQELVKNKDGSPKYTAEQLKQMEQSLKKLQDQANSGKADGKGKPATTPPAGGSPTPELNDKRPDPLAKIAESFVKKMEHSSLPEKFPAFGKFKDDVLSAKLGGGGGGSGFEDALGNMFSKSKAEGAPNVGLPEAGPLQLPSSGGVPEVPSAPFVPDLSVLSNAAGGLTSASAAGGGLALLQMLLIVAVFAVLAVLVWRFLGRTGRRAPQIAVAGLGPWPVDPARISTRQQLVQAFEYLALLLLGNQARTANHRKIAGSLGTTPENGQAAAQLASLYETARYDPAVDELPPADFSAARRDLLLLAGRRAPASGEG